MVSSSESQVKKYALIIGLVIMMVGLSFASPYEWFRNNSFGQELVLNGTFYANTNNTNSIEWYPTTTGSYLEYRTLYLSVNSTWTEVTDFEHGGFINGNTTDDTYNVSFWGFNPGNYTARITINYGNCGAGNYTATPNVATCGDIYDFNLTLN